MDRRKAPSVKKSKKDAKKASDATWTADSPPKQSIESSFMSQLTDSQFSSSSSSSSSSQYQASSQHPFATNSLFTNRSSSSLVPDANGFIEVDTEMAETYLSGVEQHDSDSDDETGEPDPSSQLQLEDTDNIDISNDATDPNADDPEPVDNQLGEEDTDVWIREKVSRDVVEMDEIEEIFKVAYSFSNKAEGEAWLNNMFFVLLACIAGDNITSINRTDSIVNHEKIANDVVLLIQNLPLKQSSFTDHVLRHCPNSKFPKSFHDFMTEKANKPASKSYLEKFKKKGSFKDTADTIQNHCFFGSRLNDTFKDAKIHITKILDRWVPAHKLKSGRNTRGLHRALREFHYRTYEFPKEAVESAKRKIKYNLRKKAEGEIYKDKTLEEWKVELEEEMIEDMDLDKQFPEWWLAFLILSRPDIIGFGVRNSFTGGIHLSKGVVAPLGKSGLVGDGSSGEVRIPEKSTRDRFHTFTKESGTVTSTATKDGSKGNGSKSNTNTLIHEVVLKPREESVYQKKLCLIERSIELRLKSGMLESCEDIKVLRKRQMDCIDRELAELDKEEDSQV